MLRFSTEEEKILPDTNPKEQYQFARNFLKVGDYDNAEKAFREFVLNNPDLMSYQVMHSIGMLKPIELDKCILMQQLHIWKDIKSIQKVK